MLGPRHVCPRAEERLLGKTQGTPQHRTFPPGHSCPVQAYERVGPLSSWAWGPPSTPEQPRDHRQLMHGDAEERLLAWGLAELGWSTRRPLGEVAVCGLEMRSLVPSTKIQ